MIISNTNREKLKNYMKIALYNGSIVYLIAIINLFATYDIGTKRLKKLQVRL